MEALRKRLIGAVLVLTVGSFAGGLLVGRSTFSDAPEQATQPQGDERDWIEDDPLRFEFVQDALSRWAKKNGTSAASISAAQSPQGMMLRDRACVQFVSRHPAPGGTAPVYCYALDDTGWPTTQLIYEASSLGE